MVDPLPTSNNRVQASAEKYTRGAHKSEIAIRADSARSAGRSFEGTQRPYRSDLISSEAKPAELPWAPIEAADKFPVTRAMELALWRAFMDAEIDAILRDMD
jgi:hypothetical protein